MNTWTDKKDLVKVWRSLRPSEEERAVGLIEQVERSLLREWRQIPAWLDADRLTTDDLIDVVVWLVLPMLGVDTDMPLNVRSWQDTGGSESRSITLAGSATDGMMELAPWMVRIFERLERDDRPDSPTGAGPLFGGGPRTGRLDALFPLWP